MIRRIVGGCMLLFAANSFAEGFFKSALETDLRDGEHSAALKVQALGCGLTLTETESQQKIVDQEGKTYIFSFDRIHRLASFSFGGVHGLVVYQGETSIIDAIVDSDTGRVLHRRNPSESAFVAQLRAEGKLPSLKGLINARCGAKIDGSIDNYDYVIYLNPNYWIDEVDSAYSDAFIDFSPLDYPGCQNLVQACIDRCNNARRGQLTSCVTAGILIGEAFGGPVGAAAGALCATVVNSSGDSCVEGCPARVGC